MTEEQKKRLLKQIIAIAFGEIDGSSKRDVWRPTNKETPKILTLLETIDTAQRILERMEKSRLK